jgi:Armadillo/beta-catenin-like repeat
VLMSIVSTVYAAYADRLAPERTFYILLSALAVMLVGNWYLMLANIDTVAYPLYYLLFEISSELLVMHASLYFSANFDNEQSKRLLPMTMAGLQLGEVAGGLILTMSSLIGVQGLVLVWSGLAATAVAIVVTRHRSVGVSPFFAPGRRGGGLKRTIEQVTQGLKFARRSKLLLYSSLAVFCMVVSLNCLGYAAFAVYNANFKSEAELSVLFGLLTIVSSSVTVLVQVFFSSKVINLFGVRAINLVFPSTTLMCFAGMIAFFNVPSALVATVNRRVLLPSMRNPSRSLLFDALPDYMQGRARALSLMLVLPCGYIFVGLVLQTLKKWHAPYSYLTAGVIAGALFLFFSIKTNRAYVEALLSTLKERLFLPSEGLGTMGAAGDPELFARLVDGVKHQDEQICLTYARMLANAFPDKAPEIIFERMQLASAPVCDQLVRLIGPKLPEELLHRLESARELGDAHERATVLATRFEAKDPRMQTQVEPCLTSENPRLITCGVLGVLSYGLDDRRDTAVQRWQSLLADTRTSSIFAALYLGQKIAMPASFLPLLCDLLEHPDDGVKKAALAALRHGGLQADARLTALLEVLAKSPDQQMRVASIECYRLLPAADRERLAFAALTDRHPNVVDAALGVLEECIEGLPDRLFTWLNDACAPPRQQQQVLAYLSRQGVPRQPFEDFAGRRLQDAAQMAQASRVLETDTARDDAGWTLMKIVLAERFTQTLEVALLAMENLGDSHSIRIVYVALKSKDKRQVARAREALTNIANSALGAQLSQLLIVASDSTAVVETVPGAASFKSAADALAWCANHVDCWLKECAKHALQAERVLAAAGG